MKPCSNTRQAILEMNWTTGDVQRVRELLAHLETCPDCQNALADYDRIRQLLACNVENAAPTEDWDARAARLTDAISRQRTWTRIIPMAIAACLLLALGFFGRSFWLTPNAPAVARNDTVAVRPVFPADEAEQDAQAFARVADVFDRHTAWMVLGDDSNIGMSNQPIASGQALVVLRLCLYQGGKVLSTADLTIVAGQSASLNLPLPGGDRVGYVVGVSNTQPLSLALTAQFKNGTGTSSTGELKTNLLVEPGRSIKAGSIQTLRGEYELKIAFGRSQGEHSGASTVQ